MAEFLAAQAGGVKDFKEGAVTLRNVQPFFAELDTARRRALAGVAATAEQVLVTAAVGEDIPADWDARRITIGIEDDESGRISVVSP